MEEDIPMGKKLEFVTDIFNQLAGFGEKIVDDVVEMVLNALPKSYAYVGWTHWQVIAWRDQEEALW